MTQFGKKLKLIFVFLSLTGCGSSVAVWTDGEVPFVRSTPQVIERMLELARVKPGDVIYDIGSGDGAIIIYAAKNMASKVSVSKSTRDWSSARAAMHILKKSSIWSSSALRTPLRSTFRRLPS